MTVAMFRKLIVLLPSLRYYPDGVSPQLTCYCSLVVEKMAAI